MRLESALYTSRSGLDAHGKAVGVVGDNIANASTTGYKSERAEFSDLFVEGPEGRRSSSDPAIGSGAAIGEVRVLHETGPIEFTGRALDIAIDGNGFFLVGDTANPQFTRAGVLSVDKDGFLVNNDGQKILGVAPGDTSGKLIELSTQTVTGGATPTTIASMIGNINAGSPITTPLTAPASFKEIAANAAFISQLPTYDSLGTPHTISLAFTKTAKNEFTVQAFIDGDEVGGVDGVPSLLGSTTLTFGTDGLIPEASKAGAKLTLAPAYSEGAAVGNIALDLSGFTQFSAGSGINSINQNGQGVSSITGYQFDKSGSFYAVLEDGSQINLGSLAIAGVRSNDGLVRSGGNNYVESDQSGTRTVGTAGSGGFGKIASGSLERSTVDIAGQFVDLVLYQRGYEANSKILSTTADMLRETIALVR